MYHLIMENHENVSVRKATLLILLDDNQSFAGTKDHATEDQVLDFFEFAPEDTSHYVRIEGQISGGDEIRVFRQLPPRRVAREGQE